MSKILVWLGFISITASIFLSSNTISTKLVIFGGLIFMLEFVRFFFFDLEISDDFQKTFAELFKELKNERTKMD